MNMTNKVLWGEGLFLRPQHFQQQDRYHEQRLNDSIKAFHPFSWGVGHMQVNRDALENNTLQFLDLALRFQDGEMVDAPLADALPPLYDLSHLPPARQSILLYAALPNFKPAGGNYSPQAHHAVRFCQSNAETADMYTQAASADLVFLKKNVRLVSEFDPRDSYIHFPLIRLQRLATGGFEVDASFVAPSLSIRSAPALFLGLRRVLDALQAKVQALHDKQREPNKSVVEFRSGDMASFWLLHTAGSALASLMHYWHHPALHPERLYQQLLALAGALMAYSKKYAFSDLPPYAHEAAGPAFASLNLMILDLLDTVISSKYVSIDLSETKPSYHHGRLDSGKLDDKTAFYLAISSDMLALELVELIPLRLKLGSPDDVEQFVLSALPGLRLQHAPQVPAAIPVRPDTCYFSIESRSPIFERMLLAQSITIYVPSGMRPMKLELIALLA